MFSIKTILTCIVFALSFSLESQTSGAIQNERDQGVRTVAWSPDGKLLATGDTAGQVVIYDLDGTIFQTFEGDETNIVDLEWSTDSTLLAVGGTSNSFKVWDLSQNALGYTVPAFPDGVYMLKWHPTGSYLLAAGFDSFQIWDTTTWQPITDALSVSFWDVEWSPDGSGFAFSSGGRVGVAAFANTKVALPTFFEIQHSAVVRSIDWDSNGTRIISAGGPDGTVRLWDAATGKQLAILLETDQVIQDVMFINDLDTQIAASSSTGSLFLIDTESNSVQESTYAGIDLWSLDWNKTEGRLAIGGTGLLDRSSATNTSNEFTIDSTSGLLDVIFLPS